MRVITVTTSSDRRVHQPQWNTQELAPTSSTVTEFGSRYTTKFTKTDECSVSRSAGKPRSGGNSNAQWSSQQTVSATGLVTALIITEIFCSALDIKF